MAIINLKVTFPKEILSLSEEIRGSNERNFSTLSKSNFGQQEAQAWRCVECIVGGKGHKINLEQLDPLSGGFTQTFQISDEEIYLVGSNLFELRLPGYINEAYTPILEKTVGVAYRTIFEQIAQAIQEGDSNFYIGGTYVTDLEVEVKYDNSKFFSRDLEGFYATSKVTSTAVQSLANMAYRMLSGHTLRIQNNFRQYPITFSEKVKAE